MSDVLFEDDMTVTLDGVLCAIDTSVPPVWRPFASGKEHDLCLVHLKRCSPIFRNDLPGWTSQRKFLNVARLQAMARTNTTNAGASREDESFSASPLSIASIVTVLVEKPAFKTSRSR